MFDILKKKKKQKTDYKTKNKKQKTGANMQLALLEVIGSVVISIWYDMENFKEVHVRDLTITTGGELSPHAKPRWLLGESAVFHYQLIALLLYNCRQLPRFS